MADQGAYGEVKRGTDGWMVRKMWEQAESSFRGASYISGVSNVVGGDAS